MRSTTVCLLTSPRLASDWLCSDRSVCNIVPCWPGRLIHTQNMELPSGRLDLHTSHCTSGETNKILVKFYLLYVRVSVDFHEGNTTTLYLYQPTLVPSLWYALPSNRPSSISVPSEDRVCPFTLCFLGVDVAGMSD